SQRCNGDGRPSGAWSTPAWHLPSVWYAPPRAAVNFQPEAGRFFRARPPRGTAAGRIGGSERRQAADPDVERAECRWGHTGPAGEDPFDVGAEDTGRTGDRAYGQVSSDGHE